MRNLPRKAALFAGAAFLFLAPRTPAHPTLTRQLVEEGDWVHAHREALLDLSNDPLDATSAFIAAIAGGIQTNRPEGVCPQLETLTGSTNAWVAAAAHLALGRLDLAAGREASAATHLTEAFLHSPDPLLAEQSAVVLAEPLPPWPSFPFSESPGGDHALRRCRARPALARRMDPARGETPGRIRRRRRRAHGFLQDPDQPAIGSRCPMHPSCSTYFRQASDKHGFWTAVAMIGDRFVREPHHYKHRIRPINVGGLEKSLDPLEYHDYWFRENGRPPVWNE
ncbi:MAG: membrane protein insertion efficiency factor YidD [Kiritimatiellia bacterium]